MTRSTRTTAAAVLFALTLSLPAAATATPAEVALRVEGASQTALERSVTTDGHTVTTPSGGTHKCDGTNAGANSTPGPTPTAALDDGARLAGLSWDATWDDSFQDFLVSSVAGETAPSGSFWSLFVNYKAAQAGGCQIIAKPGDEVLWALIPFPEPPDYTPPPAMRLDGPGEATTNEVVDVTVVDGANGAPISGASVGNTVTGADGHALLAFSEPGVYRLKAERAGAVRSNALSLCVDPPGADPCTSTDRVAPNVTIAAPYFASDARSGRFPISWQGDDGLLGSGVASYDVEVRRLDLVGADWKPLVSATHEVSWRFGGLPGATYEFRVRARDRAANVSAPATASTVVPFDNLDPALRYGRRWKLLRRPGAYKGSLLRTRDRGARATLRFRGSRVVLVGRRLPKGGRMLVRIDGRGRRIRLRGRPRHRQALFGTLGLGGGGIHTITMIALGGGPVEIDGVAVLP